MSGPLRSKRGCWTCRLRKKKCDEGRPLCATCESLSITCHGFGPKPEWMDNGEKEKAVANSIKEIVKHTSRRKATTDIPRTREIAVRLAPKAKNGVVDSSSSSPNPSNSNSASPPSAQDEKKETKIPPAEPVGTTPEDGGFSKSFLSNPDEAELLMHFLDKVFPLQYPMYKPGALDGGRGWLLSLLLKSKPLYHAALALSSYHRHAAVVLDIYPCEFGAREQERHLQLSITSLNTSINRSSAKLDVGLLVALIQLTFFELYTNHGNAWRAHYTAAMNIYLQGYENNLSAFKLAEESKKIILEDLFLPLHEFEVRAEIMSFRFVACTLIWLDVVSSITSGTAPVLLPYYLVISPNVNIRVDGITGCRNWALHQISRIAALHDAAITPVEDCTPNCTEFAEIVVDITSRIASGLSEYDPATMLNTPSDPTVIVTHIFAHSSLLYLHLVTKGFRGPDILETAVPDLMITLQTQVPTHLFTSLLIPLYIIGTAARQEDEAFFREIFSTAPLLEPGLQHRAAILPVLEGVWAKRRENPILTWKESLEDAGHILLI